MEILQQFGIQPILLLAQIVNFLIILFLLTKFFYKPIAKMLNDRKVKIEESLKNADLIEQQLAQTEEKTKKLLEDAQNQAQTLIGQARQTADTINQETAQEARKTLEETLVRARDEIERQKQDMKKELEKETLTLVVEVTKKVLAKTLNQKERNELTSNAISEINKQL